MNIEELFALTEWIDKEIKGRRVVENYNDLVNILNRNLQPNQIKLPFEEQKSRLFTVLEAVELQRLSVDQLKFLDKLGIAQNVGGKGIFAIEDILVRNPVDLATAVTRIGELSSHIAQGLNKSNQIKTGLSGLVEVGPTEIDRVLVRISFSGKASMKNIVDFKKWGLEWHDIGRGIAMVHGGAPEDIQIIGAKNGSIVIELAVVPIVAHTVSTIILGSLKVVERILNIKKMAVEIRGLHLANEKITKELDKEAEIEKEKEIEHIKNEVVKRLGKNIDRDGDQIKALDVSIKKLVCFLENGGEVDCVAPEEKKSEDENIKQSKVGIQNLKELRSTMAEIRKLEDKIKQIEYKK